LVERETCETAGDMEAKLAGEAEEWQGERPFPYSNWGPWAAVLGVVMAIGVGILMGIPGLFFQEPDGEDLTVTGNILIQVGTVLGFLLVPMAIAAWRGAQGLPQILARLGVRRFKPSAFGWIAAAIGAYLLFAFFYSLLIVVPEQEDIAESFGPVGAQVLLIVIGASISEELCFRGMLFGGLREKLPKYAAALIAGALFGALHALTGVTAVPPLIAFGFILALLYEKTGSIVPGILLHMLNNSVALLAQ
jgi:membrane protease YdiL (CAAX protease family)